MTVAQVRGVVSDRTPAEALAYCDGYEAGLGQARAEAASALRRWAKRVAEHPDLWPAPQVEMSLWLCARDIETDRLDDGDDP